MTKEEQEKMAALEAENKRLKEEAEKKAAEGKKDEDKGEKFSDSPEFADMQKEIAELKAAKKNALVKGVCDKFADIPAGLKDSVQKVASVLADNQDSFEFSDKDGNKTEKSALDMFCDIVQGIASAPKKDEVTSQQFDAGEFSDKGKKTDGKETDWGKVAASI